MLQRKEIFILSPSSINGARSTLAYCVEQRDELRELSEEYPVEVQFDELGLMIVFQGPENVDTFIDTLRRSILYYESLPESQRSQDPPRRMKQPDPSFKHNYLDPPTTPTSTWQSEHLHPYFALLFGGSESLDTSKPLFLRMDEKRRSVALKALKELKRRPWHHKTFNDSLAYALSGIGCNLKLRSAEEYRWFVEGVEFSVRYPMAVRGNTSPSHLVVTCEPSTLTANTLPQVSEQNCVRMSILLDQLRREAPYMNQRFHEQSFTFTIGSHKLTIKHRWDYAAVCDLLETALKQPPSTPSATVQPKTRALSFREKMIELIRRFDLWLHSLFAPKLQLATPEPSPEHHLVLQRTSPPSTQHSSKEIDPYDDPHYAVIGVPVPEDEL